MSLWFSALASALIVAVVVSVFGGPVWAAEGFGLVAFNVVYWSDQ